MEIKKRVVYNMAPNVGAVNLDHFKMTEENLPRLRAKRAANRGVVTKLIEESDAILENDAAQLDMKTRNRLTRIDTMLKEKLQLLSELDEKILTASEVDDIIKEVEDAEFFKMDHMDAIANISTSTKPAVPKTYLQHQENSNDPSIPPASTTTSANASIPLDSSSSASHSHPNPTVLAPRPSNSRLPKITLARFKGEVTQFRSFWDSFESTVHTNTSLTKIDKFNYLVSLLEGTASRAIAGLPITEENYDAAVDIINKRFGKPQQLISAHMDELLKISTCSTDKPYQLRYLYDKLSVNIRGLEALGVKANQYGSLLIPIVMAKLPPEIRVHVARNTTEDVWDIESILNVIQNEIEAREISEKIKAMTSNTEPKRPNYERPSFPKNPTMGGTFLTGSTPPMATPICVYCSEMHFSASCQKITDVNARKEILKSGRRCFSCLRKGHNSGQCDKSCRRCNRKHHQSICLEQPRNTNQPPHLASGEHKDRENDGTTTATTTSENANTKVLLQTAHRDRDK